MDFARKQLEKYGWTTGKGLGKNENGISEALKPKIKRSVTGIGHNAAEDFTEHWWTALYNKAAENVEFKQKNGDSKKFETKEENAFAITNSTWKLNNKQKDRPNEEYKDFFVKTEILGNDGTKNIKESESESEEDEKRDVFKLTDEELFAACGGRTAHKAARFGLKATGKLARIKEQEEKLLDLDKYNGYSHAKNKNSEATSTTLDGDVDDEAKRDSNVETVSDTCSKKKKKKKRKAKNKEDLKAEPIGEESVDIKTVDDVTEQNNQDDDSNVETIKKQKKSKQKISATVEYNDTEEQIQPDSNTNNETIKKKKKRKNCDPIENNDENVNESNMFGDGLEINTKKKKCKRKNTEKALVSENIEQTQVNIKKNKKKKKYKNK